MGVCGYWRGLGTPRGCDGGASFLDGCSQDRLTLAFHQEDLAAGVSTADGEHVDLEVTRRFAASVERVRESARATQPHEPPWRRRLKKAPHHSF